MDLTKSFPRSPRETVHGLAMAARTIDKARADAAGTAGEYSYNCPIDNALFGFLGTNADEFKTAVLGAADDAGAMALMQQKLAGKSPSEIEAYNAGLLGHSPQPGTEVMQYFVQARQVAAPDRTDVTTWTDLIDLEEGREVPQRAAAGVGA